MQANLLYSSPFLHTLPGCIPTGDNKRRVQKAKYNSFFWVWGITAQRQTPVTEERE